MAFMFAFKSNSYPGFAIMYKVAHLQVMISAANVLDTYTSNVNVYHITYDLVVTKSELVLDHGDINFLDLIILAIKSRRQLCMTKQIPSWFFYFAITCYCSFIPHSHHDTRAILCTNFKYPCAVCRGWKPTVPHFMNLLWHCEFSLDNRKVGALFT